MRKFFASIFVFAFVTIFVPGALAIGVYQTFGNEEFYQNEFAEQIRNFIIKTVPEKADYEEMGGLIDEDEFREILEKAITKDDIVLVISDIARQFKETKIGENGEYKLALDLSWLHKKSETLSKEVADAMAEGLPVCESLEEFQASPDVPKCIPEEVPRDMFVSQLELGVKTSLFSELPEELSADLPPLPFGHSMTLASFVRQFFDVTFKLGLIILAALMIVIMMIMFSPWPRVLKWGVRPLVTGSFSVLLMMAVFRWIPIENISLTENLSDFVVFYKFIFTSLSNKVFIYMVPIFCVSFLLFVVFSLLEKKVAEDMKAEHLMNEIQNASW